MEAISPSTVAELATVITDAAAEGERLEIRGGGSKSAFGRSGHGTGHGAHVLDMRRFSGVIDYDPAELVLVAGAATPLAEIQALVAAAGQHLAFDPFDHGPIFGQPAGKSTIGGCVASGTSGSRRLTAGGCRDHLLGFTAVSGRGEAFKAGAKVVKNVTGYDLPKLVTGSWGRIAALTEVVLKVMPRPPVSATLALHGLDLDDAYRTMSLALGSRAGVSAAAFLPMGLDGAGQSLTALRLDGFDPSLPVRIAMLDGLPAADHACETLSGDAAELVWSAARDLSPLGRDGDLWRASLPARSCRQFIAGLGRAASRYLVDWGGGLVWLRCDRDPKEVRRLAGEVQGHATLVSARSSQNDVSTFHPLPRPLADLDTRVRRAFDPKGVFETGRFELRNAD